MSAKIDKEKCDFGMEEDNKKMNSKGVYNVFIKIHSILIILFLNILFVYNLIIYLYDTVYFKTSFK